MTRNPFPKFAALLAICALPSTMEAACASCAEPAYAPAPVKIIPYSEARQNYGIRFYNYGYPYRYSMGPRYDPYWSYNSSYFPETYHGDGSYYGIGYSGGTASGYWYW